MNYIAKSVAVSGDGQYVAVGTQYQVVYFNRSGSQLWEYSVPDYVGSVKASDDGRRIVATTRQTLYYLDGNGSSYWQSPLHDWTGSLSMSDDGDLIVAGTYNNTFTILDETGMAKEINLDTISAIPNFTTVPRSVVNMSVAPSRSQPAPVNPLLAGLAFGSVGVIFWIRNPDTKAY